MLSESDSIKTCITDYLGKYLEHFTLNLEKAMEGYDPEAIHEYRVSVKRIRAIISAINSIYDDPLFSGKMIQPLRLMFKAGGTIRDDQVQIGLVENIEKEFGHAFPLIKSYFYKRIENQRNSFFLKSIDFEFESINSISGQIDDILDPLDDSDLEGNLYRWLHESMEKLKRKIALAEEFAEELVTWGYTEFWRPSRGEKARAYYSDYREWVSQRGR